MFVFSNKVSHTQYKEKFKLSNFFVREITFPQFFAKWRNFLRNDPRY